MLLAAVLVLPLACTRAAPVPHSAVPLFRLRLDSVGRVRCTAALARHGTQRVGSAGSVAGGVARLGGIQPREKVEGHAHGARQAPSVLGGETFRFFENLRKIACVGTRAASTTPQARQCTACQCSCCTGVLCFICDLSVFSELQPSCRPITLQKCISHRSGAHLRRPSHPTGA